MGTFDFLFRINHASTEKKLCKVCYYIIFICCMRYRQINLSDTCISKILGLFAVSIRNYFSFLFSLGLSIIPEFLNNYNFQRQCPLPPNANDLLNHIRSTIAIKLLYLQTLPIHAIPCRQINYVCQ